MAEFFERISATTYSGTYSHSGGARLVEAHSTAGVVAIFELPNSKRILSPSGNETFFLENLFRTLKDGWLLSRVAL